MTIVVAKSTATSMDIWGLFGYAKLRFHSHRSPIDLPSKDHADPINLLDLCKRVTPTACRLNALLFNGHLQTFWTAVKSRRDVVIFYKRHVFVADDPAVAGTFAVDFVVGPNNEAVDGSLPPRTTYYTDSGFGEIGSMDAKPMLVTLHGLSGGSHEVYLRHVLKPMVDAGWEACVVNSRGCAMSKITTGVLYNARATWGLYFFEATSSSSNAGFRVARQSLEQRCLSLSRLD